MSARPAYPYLLTPGPLTISMRTKEAMLRDWGSWDTDFNQITGRICEQLVGIIHGAPTHVCVPLQGSGTFSVEAAIGTLAPRDAHVLVPINGAYFETFRVGCMGQPGEDGIAGAIDAVAAVHKEMQIRQVGPAAELNHGYWRARDSSAFTPS